MAKKTFKNSELATITGAAKKVGRPRSALRQAIVRGRVQSVELACGAAVVVMASVVAWDKSDSKPGRKPS